MLTDALCRCSLLFHSICFDLRCNFLFVLLMYSTSRRYRFSKSKQRAVHYILPPDCFSVFAVPLGTGASPFRPKLPTFHSIQPSLSRSMDDSIKKRELYRIFLYTFFGNPSKICRAGHYSQLRLFRAPSQYSTTLIQKATSSLFCVKTT